MCSSDLGADASELAEQKLALAQTKQELDIRRAKIPLLKAQLSDPYVTPEQKEKINQQIDLLQSEIDSLLLGAGGQPQLRSQEDLGVKNVKKTRI